MDLDLGTDGSQWTDDPIWTWILEPMDPNEWMTPYQREPMDPNGRMTPNGPKKRDPNGSMSSYSHGKRIPLAIIPPRQPRSLGHGRRRRAGSGTGRRWETGGHKGSCRERQSPGQLQGGQRQGGSGGGGGSKDGDGGGSSRGSTRGGGGGSSNRASG